MFCVSLCVSSPSSPRVTRKTTRAAPKPSSPSQIWRARKNGKKSSCPPGWSDFYRTLPPVHCPRRSPPCSHSSLVPVCASCVVWNSVHASCVLCGRVHRHQCMAHSSAWLTRVHRSHTHPHAHAAGKTREPKP